MRLPRFPLRRVFATVLLCCALLAGSGPAAAAAPAASDGRERGDWLWPVEGRREVREPFRAPADEYAAGHRGMDIAASVGGEVRAPADGVVAFRGVVVDRPLLTIDHGAGIVATFEPLESSLSPGDVVAAGEVIGAVAVGGHSDAGALHVGVRLHGVYIDPRLLFGGAARAVLLPCCAPL
ncbi:murein hydrolase activator EnvC family protein [Microbacterium tumbae]